MLVTDIFVFVLPEGKVKLPFLCGMSHFTPIVEHSKAKRELYSYFRAMEEICVMTNLIPSGLLPD